MTGKVDYTKLMEKFGTQPIDLSITSRIQEITGSDPHFMPRRGIFFTHRDLGWLLDQYSSGNPFYLYTGRGPSAH